MNFNGLQTVEGQNHSFRAASKGYKRKYCVSVYKLNVQILNQMTFIKMELQLNNDVGKTTMSDDFELGGEDEMEPTSNVTFSKLL